MRIRSIQGVVVIAAAVAGALSAGPGAAAQEKAGGAPAQIVARPKKDQVLRWRYRRAERSQVQGEARAWVQERDLVYVWKVLETKPEGGAVLEMTMESSKGHFPGADGKRVDYDTAAKAPLPEDPEAKLGVLGETYLVGATLRVTMDARGRMTDATGVREAAKKAFAGTSVANDPAMDAPNFGTSQIGEFFFATPDARPAGATWSDRIPGRMGELTFAARPTFTMREPTADTVVVDGDWTGSIPSKDGKRTSDYTGTSTYTWSRADGLALVAKVNIAVKSSGDKVAEASLDQVLERIDAAPVAPAGPVVKLGVAPPVGAAARFRYVRACSSKVVEMEQSSVDDLTREYAVRVKSAAPSGGATLEVTFGRSSGRFDMGSGPIDFDTAAAALPEEPIAKLRVSVAKALVGKPVEIDVDASGTPTAVRGAREILVAALKGQTFGALGDATAMLDDAAILEIVADGFLPGFSGERAVGASWNASDATRRLGRLPVGYDETFTLRSSEGGKVTVDEAYAYRAAKGAMAGLAGDGRGTSVWDATDGFAVSVVREWKLAGKGRFTVEAARKETLERLAAPAAKTPPATPPATPGKPAPKTPAPPTKPPAKPAPKTK